MSGIQAKCRIESTCFILAIPHRAVYVMTSNVSSENYIICVNLRIFDATLLLLLSTARPPAIEGGLSTQNKIIIGVGVTAGFTLISVLILVIVLVRTQRIEAER